MFFLFGSKTSNIPDMFRDGIDMHTHILPGVDDGARSMDKSLELIDSLKSLGLRGAYCTPHIMAARPGNTIKELTARFRQLRDRVEGFELRLSGEYMLDESLAPKLEAREILTYDGRRILVELPHAVLPLNWKEMLFNIEVSGYIPVLAHPERYGTQFNADDYVFLKERKVEFQLNLPSLSGYYGSAVRQLAVKLLKKDWYEHFGSDAHGPRHAAALRQIPERYALMVKSRINHEYSR